MIKERDLLGGLSLSEYKTIFMGLIKESQPRMIGFMKKVEETDNFERLYNLCDGAAINYNNIVICKILEKDDLSFEQLKKIYYVRKRKMFKEIILLRMLRKIENSENLLWIMKVSKNNSVIWGEANNLLEAKA
jgi:hypothetical protein